MEKSEAKCSRRPRQRDLSMLAGRGEQADDSPRSLHFQPRQRASAARSEVTPEPRELRGRGGERPCSTRVRASRAIPTPEASGWRCGKGKVAGVARWRRNRNAAARDGKANGAGGSRGGVSEAKALAEAGRGAVRAKRGGTRRLRAERHARKRARANTPRPQNALAAGRRFSRPRWPEGQPRAPRAWELPSSGARLAHGQRAGRRWRCACLSAGEGRGAPHPHDGAEPHSARRRARLDWRRGQPRASEG